ncbi:MAG: DEAD/DEAH box helicase [Chromatiales bacterium]
MSARATSEPLPIEAVLPEVRAALARGRRAVVQAPPGAGKSTVLPLALLHERWLAERRIVMLEPRLAARSVAYWMAHLLGEAAGQRVGYRMRLESRLSVATRIEVVTEGVLTRMLQGDPTLEGVGCVIFDEFHERSLHADLGLALCLEAQAQVREDLRILVMSATLDAQSIAEWLGDAPIIRAEGQSFPVDTRYMPRATTARIERSIVAAVVRALREGDGDALVFLPGAGEIRRVQRLLEEQNVGAEVRILAALWRPAQG